MMASQVIISLASNSNERGFGPLSGEPQEGAFEADALGLDRDPGYF